ncbi:MAG: nitrilase-related carbon-nitrogen hydrolase [Coriobacteriales bacterium]|nr:nitrilase-related carbon-nitrogen hydrolase [Coriobacteriales bacterium]
MRIAVAQLNTRSGDFEKTAARMVELSQSASEQGADLLVFSFATLTGFIAPDYPDFEGYTIDLFDAFDTLVEELACPCIVPVMGDLVGSFSHEAFLVEHGRLSPLREPAGIPHESGRRTGASEGIREAASGEPLQFSFGGMRLGIAFSYQEIDRFNHAGRGVDALIYIAQYNFAIDDASSAMGAALKENRFCNDAVALDAWFVGVGSVGGYGLHLFSGSSFVVDPAGKLVASAPAFEEALISADIQPRKEDAFLYASRHDYLIVPEIFNRALHLWQALSMGLHDFADKLGYENMALQLDGRLNSSVLLALASDAVGPTHVFALLAPGLEPANQEAARKLAKSLHVTLGEDAFEIPASADKSLREDLGQAQLAALARAHNALVLGTQDKTFLALEAQGPCCHAADLLPLGDVYRSDVLELAHLRNTISPVMPTEIFSQLAVPDIEGLKEVESTPKLQLERVDVTLANRIEWARPLTDVIARRGEPELTERIINRLYETEAARLSWPSCLTVTSRTLLDAHCPLDMAWRDRKRDIMERMRTMELFDLLFEDEEDLDGDEVKSAFGGFSDMLANADQELSFGSLPEGMDSGGLERSIDDLLGLLKDMIQEGGLTMENNEGPTGPFTWGSPFSEN